MNLIILYLISSMHSGYAHYSHSGSYIRVLHVSRVMHPDYLSYDCVRTVSKDKLLFLFCEKSSSSGDRQNTPYSGFAKGLRFLNMVMTLIFHPLSHYNSITEPRARFLLSLLEGLTIDFPSHFILSLIDVYKDTATRDKLIFPSAITRILRHFSVSYPESTHFSPMCAIDGMRLSFDQSGHGPRLQLLRLFPLLLHPLLLHWQVV